MEARLSDLKSRCLGKSKTAVCCLGCVWSARSRLWVLLCAALAQLGLSSEPQQICGEETRYSPWKNQVLLLLRWFVPSNNKAWWLSGQRDRLPISRCGFDFRFRCIFLSFFLRGHVTKVRLRKPEPNVGFSVAEWLALLRCQWWCRDSVEVRGSNPIRD